MRLYEAASQCRSALLWGFIKNEGQGFDLDGLNLGITARAALAFIDGSGCDQHGAVVHNFKVRNPDAVTPFKMGALYIGILRSFVWRRRKEEFLPNNARVLKAELRKVLFAVSSLRRQQYYLCHKYMPKSKLKGDGSKTGSKSTNGSLDDDPKNRASKLKRAVSRDSGQKDLSDAHNANNLQQGGRASVVVAGGDFARGNKMSLRPPSPKSSKNKQKTKIQSELS